MDTFIGLMERRYPIVQRCSLISWELESATHLPSLPVLKKHFYLLGQFNPNTTITIVLYNATDYAKNNLYNLDVWSVKILKKYLIQTLSGKTRKIESFHSTPISLLIILS